jgi:Fur family transcriptional regulator, ferric uptake regulator
MNRQIPTETQTATLKTHAHTVRRQELSALTRRLRGQTRKVTGQREAILEILRQHPHPLTNKDILAALPRGLCDLATIYRTLHLLEKMGMVKRFDFSDGVARYELLGEDDDGHHHHLVCMRCGAVVRIEECFLQEIESRIAATNGFTAVTHKLEFFGLCPHCQ